MQVDILMQVGGVLYAAYQAAGFGDLEVDEAVDSLEFCDISYGDFASNLAMRQAKSLKMAPREIAERLTPYLQDHPNIDSVEVAGPGFLNIRLGSEVWAQFIKQLDGDFFRTEHGKGTRVNIEFVSANPTGPLVLVNAWNGFYGDVLARLYESQGYEVTREYYLNDGGNQIAQLGRAVQQATGMEFAAEVSEELYRGPYIDELAERMVGVYGSADAVQALSPAELGDQAQKLIFAEYIQPTLKRLGIPFDEVYPESILNNTDTIQRLEVAGAVVHKDGAVWFSGEKAGLDKDEVLVRSTDNQETYFLKDISYQYGKLVERGFDRAITIVGPDHHGQEKRLAAALQLLGVQGFVPLWTQAVRLIKDGEEFKMSKRRGNFILLDEFLNVVPVDTARFFFALRDPNTHFDLDLDLVSAQNKHNPLYYVMYAYVRMGSVLKKAKDDGVLIDEAVSCIPKSDLDRALVRQLVELQRLIGRAVHTQQVHSVLHALVDFAGLFHDWYERNPILKASGDERAVRLVLIGHVYIAIQGILKLIGVTPQERME